MLDKIKNNLIYVFCAGIGVLNFILLAIPYVASFYSYNYGQYGGTGSSSAGISGYNVMKLWEFGFGGVMSALIQIFILILGIALLAYGVMGLLKAFGIFEKFPDKLGKVDMKKIGEFGLYGLGGLNVLLLIFLIVLTATNTESSESYGYSTSAGIRFSAGVFLAIIFIGAGIAGYLVLNKKFPAGENTATVSYVCNKCGNKAKAKDKFCSQCGGEIERKVVVKEEYVCSKCEKKAKAKDKFCSECGGEIIKKEQTVNQTNEQQNLVVEDNLAEVVATEIQGETAESEEQSVSTVDVEQTEQSIPQENID